MLNQLSNLELWLIMGLVFVIPTTITTLITVLFFRRKVLKMEDYVLMSLIKCDKILDSENEKTNIISELDECMKYIADEVDSLSSSNKMVLDRLHHEEQQRHRVHNAYPTPDMARAIDQTIKDQISNEMTLSYKLNAPPKNYIHTIVNNVSRTYPQISIDYLSKRCISMIEVALHSR